MNNKKKNDGLIPNRYPQGDLFICDVSDAILKDVMPQMEHPFYSLSKKPETTIRRYEHNGNWLEVIPSVKGLVTIYDKDILVYGISQIIEKKKRGEKVTKRIRINTHEYLKFTNRGTSGPDYVAFVASLERLRGTMLTTNIKTGNIEQIDTFGLIDSSSVKREHGLDGRLLSVEITLSDWIFNAIECNNILTLHRDYFRLRRPTDKRIYELGRKHCGRKNKFSIGIELLWKKSGSRASIYEFRRIIEKMANRDDLPDYHIEFDKDKDQLTYFNRETWWKDYSAANNNSLSPLKTDTYEKAKKAAPRYDVYYLEGEWRLHWADSGKPTIENPDAAFIGFCKHRNEKTPMP